MTDDGLLHDEDRQMKSLALHKAIKIRVAKLLEREGIEYKITTDMDRGGDILVIREDEVPLVKELIRNIGE